MKINLISPRYTPFSKLSEDKKISVSHPIYDSYNFSCLNQLDFDYLSFTGSVNNKIKGHNREKREIDSALIDPVLLKSSSKIPPIILLYGGDEELINKFISYINKKLINNAIFVNLTNVKNEKFIQTIKDILISSKKNYIESKKPTIVQIDNAEKILGVNQAELAELLDYEPTLEEVNLVQKNNGNASIINEIKSTADFCSCIPQTINDKGNATVFLITSNYPHLIHPDLLTRQGKLTPVFIEYEDKIEIKDHLQYLLRKANKKLEVLKKMDKTELEKQNLPYFAWKNLQKLKKQNKLDILNLNVKKIPLDLIAELCEANEATGAYKLKDFDNIIDKAFYKYIENPDKEFSSYLITFLSLSNRGISPKKYIKDLQIKSMISSKSNTNNSQILRDEYFLDILTLKEKEELSELIIKEKIEKLILESKQKNSSITGNERERLEYLNIITTNDNNILKDTNMFALTQKYILKRIDLLSSSKYRFSYLDGKNDSVIFQLGDQGNDANTLWINSSDIVKIKIVKECANTIKMIRPFENIKKIEFAAQHLNSNISDLIKTNKKISNNKTIYEIQI